MLVQRLGEATRPHRREPATPEKSAPRPSLHRRSRTGESHRPSRRRGEGHSQGGEQRASRFVRGDHGAVPHLPAQASSRRVGRRGLEPCGQHAGETPRRDRDSCVRNMMHDLLQRHAQLVASARPGDCCRTELHAAAPSASEVCSRWRPSRTRRRRTMTDLDGSVARRTTGTSGHRATTTPPPQSGQAAGASAGGSGSTRAGRRRHACRPYSAPGRDPDARHGSGAGPWRRASCLSESCSSRRRVVS